MKRIISSVIVCVMLLGCVFVLASCGNKLSGDYKLLTTTYSFSGSKVSITYEVFGFTKTLEGEYEITTNDKEESVIIFTIASEEEGAEDYSGEFAFAEGEENGVEYIKIGGFKYTKVEEK